MTDVAEAVDERPEHLSKDDLQSLDVICEIGYEAVRTLEAILGEQPSPAWCDLSPERVSEIEAGVKFILDKPSSSLAAQHDAWRARNVYRLDKDDPRLVKFDQLPFGMQLKARLWRHIVHAIVG